MTKLCKHHKDLEAKQKYVSKINKPNSFMNKYGDKNKTIQTDKRSEIKSNK